MTNNLFIDIHVIQTVPPSNINRDDTGSPKTAQYGGVTRARVSSQSWKKAMRLYFKAHGENIGIRSKYIVQYLAERIQEIDMNKSEEDAIKLAKNILSKVGFEVEKDNRLKASFFWGDRQVKKIAQAAIDGVVDKKDKKELRELLKELKESLKENPTIDIALFGRMLAKEPMLNEDASAQVAHAMSTHAVKTEFDFFTATDDMPIDHSGAAHLDTTEFNSSTLYRYANVAAHELMRQLLDDKEVTINALKLFVEAFVKSMPTGKINAFANQTLPSAVVVSLRKDRPVNVVNAFEMPVETKKGYVETSIKKLEQGLTDAQIFVSEPLSNLTIGLSANNQKNFDALLTQLGKELNDKL